MDDDRLYEDEQWDDMENIVDNQAEFNAEDDTEDVDDEKKEQHKDTAEEDWDESMGYARRDTDDTLMLTASLDRTLDVYHNPSQQIKMTEDKTKSNTNWTNTSNEREKKQSAKTKLLSKISSKLDTYSA